MTQDEIIRMAREAGAEATHYETWGDVYEFDVELLERFAALVAAHEREACAKVCDEIGGGMSHPYIANNCAAAIRARGE